MSLWGSGGDPGPWNPSEVREGVRNLRQKCPVKVREPVGQGPRWAGLGWGRPGGERGLFLSKDEELATNRVFPGEEKGGGKSRAGKSPGCWGLAGAEQDPGAREAGERGGSRASQPWGHSQDSGLPVRTVGSWEGVPGRNSKSRSQETVGCEMRVWRGQELAGQQLGSWRERGAGREGGDQDSRGRGVRRAGLASPMAPRWLPARGLLELCSFRLCKLVCS